MAHDDQSGPPTLADLWLKPSPARSSRTEREPTPPQPTAANTPQLDLLFSAPALTAAPPPRRIFSVAELVSTIRGRLEHDHPDVLVEGEISNCRAAASGHLYLTLKDGDAQLPVVLFRNRAQLLKVRTDDLAGLAVLARGRISIYEPRGQLQLIAESLEPLGAGALQLHLGKFRIDVRSGAQHPRRPYQQPRSCRVGGDVRDASDPGHQLYDQHRNTVDAKYP